jgi:trk system potassium uptake protein TrkH
MLKGGWLMAVIHNKGWHNPARILVLSYLFLIFIGTILLKCPFTLKEPISWLTAFFTATSATTVTGLLTVFNGDVFSPAGHIVILLLIQLGGLGIMTIAVIVFSALNIPISIHQKLMIQEALNQHSISGIMRLVRRLFVFSAFFEGFFAILLAIRLIPEWGWGRGLSYAGFLSVSAFNNAGITFWPDSLSHYVGDVTINILISALVILGGIGFTVMNDIWDKKRWRAFSLHTKLMIIGTVILNVIGTVVIFLIERDNAKTLGNLPMGEAMLAAFFQEAMTRSAGFNTVDISSLEPASLFFMIMYMFIGSGSVSTGGGIKLTTFLCLMAMVSAFIKRKKAPVILGRTIHRYDIYKALTVTLLSIGVIFSALFLLLLFEQPGMSFLKIAFETVSAFGTTGLSAGVVSHLSPMGQVVLSLMMIFGKLGPLTFLFSVAQRENDAIRYPHGKLFIG